MTLSSSLFNYFSQFDSILKVKRFSLNLSDNPNLIKVILTDFFKEATSLEYLYINLNNTENVESFEISNFITNAVNIKEVVVYFDFHGLKEGSNF